MKKIIFAAGGTGGHLFPAQALAEQLQDTSFENNILFVGAKLRDNAYFDKTQFAYFDIISATPYGGGLSKIFHAAIILLKGIWQSLRLLKQEKPDLIVGFGSFHTFPILCAAVFKNIPLVLFESNAIPGKVVRLFAKKALFTGIYFSEAKNYLKGNVIEVEIPIKKASMKKAFSREEARLHFNLDPHTPTLLVFGGSQGAKKINRTVIEMLPLLQKIPFQLLHFTGSDETAEEVNHLCQRLGVRCIAKKFESEMHIAYSSADLAICRSGAMTLSELLFYEVPSILIPYPSAADQHQLKNAEYMAHQVRGALHLTERLLTPSQLADLLLPLLADQNLQRTQMQEAMRHFKTQQKKAEMNHLINRSLANESFNS